MEEAAENAYNGTVQAVDGVGTAVSSYNSSMNNAINKTDSLSETMINYGNSTDVAINSTEELSEATEKAAKEAENSGKIGADAINTVASALAAAGIATAIKEISGALMEASDSAAQFESAMMKVATIADTSEISLTEIQSQITALSKDTGQSVTDLSEAVYSAMSASVDTANAVEFTATATKLASGGFTSSATAVDVLTTALNAYGLEANEAENISDMLITTQNLDKTTVDELAASVGKVIPLASAYGVEMDNLSAAYAELTKGGIATAEAGTYLKSTLNELGNSGSAVAATLAEETGYSFAALMEQGYSLGDVMEILGDSVNGDATAFNELWSSQEAGIGALSLFNAGAEQFNDTLAAMQTSAGATQAAFETMTDTTAHAKEEFSNAALNLQNSIGSTINPAIEELYNAGTNVLNLASNFVDENPAVVKGFVAVGTGVGTVAVAFGGLTAAVGVYKAGVLIATAAQEAFNISLAATLGPVTLVAAGVTGVAAAVMTLKDNYDSTYDEFMSMTAVAKQQTIELENLEAEYDKMCDTYGELSPEASELKVRIDDLSTALENNGGSIEAALARTDNLISKHEEIISAYEDTSQAVKDEEINNFALITKLEQLAAATDTTAGSQEAMKKIIDSLNGSISGLNLSYDEFMSGGEGSGEYLRAMAEREAKQQQYNADYETYIKLLGETSDLEADVAEKESYIQAARSEVVKANDAYTKSYNSLGNLLTLGLQAEFDGTRATYDAASDEMNGYIQKHQEAEAALQANQEQIEELGNKLGITADSAEILGDKTSVVTMKVGDLVEAYNEAYEAAVTSFEGQFGLFDTAEADMSATVDAAQSALDSQLSYWENYSANIEVLRNTSAEDLNITQSQYEQIMSYAQGGSEQAAGFAASMVEAINSGNEEAIAKIATTQEAITTAQAEVAKSQSEWQLGINGEIEDFIAQLENTVANDMDMSDEARASATQTIDAYASGILQGQSKAVSAAQSVAQSVVSAFQNAGYSISVDLSTYTVGHAGGTTNAEDIFIAGEEGPELIVGKRGSTVFPHEETERIIDAVSNPINNDNLTQYINSYDYSRNVNNGVYAVENDIGRNNSSIFIPVNDGNVREDTSSGGLYDYGTRKVLLEIAGKGNIDVTGGKVDDDTLLTFLYQYLKPVLLQIIQQEVYEEGDYSYNY